MDVQVAPPPVFLAPSDPLLPYLRAGSLALLICVLVSIVVQLRRLRARSPRGQLIALAARVRERAQKADPAMAAPLQPAIDSAWKAVRSGRVDPASSEGKRIAEVLVQVDRRLGSIQQRIRTDAEREVVEEAVLDRLAKESRAEELARPARQN